MADLSDVENAIVSLLVATIYPNGTGAPSAAVLADSSNPTVRVFPGWPLPDSLDADLAAGVVNVSVFSQAGMERNTTRYPTDWYDQTVVAPTLTASVANSTITLAGSITPGNYISVLCFNQAFSYGVQPSDTLASVATALAALINAVVPAYASGDAVVIIGRTDIIARTAAPGVLIQELERSNQRFLLTVHAPTNDARQAVARLIRPAFAAINFLSLADSSQGRVVYECSNDIDEAEKANCYRRDVIYWVEYPITMTEVGYPITIPQVVATSETGDLPGEQTSTFNQIS